VCASSRSTARAATPTCITTLLRSRWRSPPPLYRFTAPDGTVTEAKLKLGMAMYVDAVDHSTEIGGDAGSRVLLIELKDARFLTERPVAAAIEEQRRAGDISAHRRSITD
jgi:hypothetical protein